MSFFHWSGGAPQLSEKQGVRLIFFFTIDPEAGRESPC
jgi:hypothetical protein